MERQGYFYKKEIKNHWWTFYKIKCYILCTENKMQILGPDINYTFTLPGKYSGYLTTEYEMCRLEKSNFKTKAVYLVLRLTNNNNNNNIRGF